MTTLADPYPFIPRATLNRLGSTLDSVGSPDRPLGEFNAISGEFTNTQVLTVNGTPYPPAGAGDLVDTSIAIVDAIDPTIRITFDAAGSAGTTGRMTFNQAASRTYTFQDPGADTEVFLSEGTQTVTGTKTFSDNGIRVVDPVDNTIAVAFDSAGAAGTTATIETNNTTSRAYTLIDPGVDTDVVLAEGAQTIAGTKTIADTALNIANSVDPTIVLAFDAAGTPGTTATINMAQGANNTYNFAEPGADTDVFLTAGAQSAVGAKTFSDGAFTIYNTVTPTAQIQFQLDGNAGTSSTLSFNQNAAIHFILPNAAANADVLLTEGNQTVVSPIGFAGGIATDLITEITPGFGTVIEDVRVVQVSGLVDYMQIIPNAAPASIGLVLTPKGGGAITTVESDAGGTTQPRGAGAIDFQRSITTGNAGATGSVIVTGTACDISPPATRSGILTGGTATIGVNSVNCVCCASTGSISTDCTNSAAIGGSNVIGTLTDNSVTMGGNGNSISTSANCATLAGQDNDILNGTNCGTAGGITNVINGASDSAIVGSQTCSMLGVGTDSTVMMNCDQVTINTNMVNCGMLDCIQTIVTTNDNCTNSVAIAQNNLDIFSCVGSVAVSCQSATLSNSTRTVLSSVSGPATTFDGLTDCLVVAASSRIVNTNANCVSVNGDIDTSSRSVSVNFADVSASQDSFANDSGAIVTSAGSIVIGAGTADIDDTVMVCLDPVTASDVTIDPGCVYFCAGATPGYTIVLSSADNGAGVTSLQAKNYTTDILAAGGGIQIGEIYRNGSNLQIRVA